VVTARAANSPSGASTSTATATASDFRAPGSGDYRRYLIPPAKPPKRPCIGTASSSPHRRIEAGAARWRDRQGAHSAPTPRGGEFKISRPRAAMWCPPTASASGSRFPTAWIASRGVTPVDRIGVHPAQR
jgi:hypothetical protein